MVTEIWALSEQGRACKTANAESTFLKTGQICPPASGIADITIPCLNYVAPQIANKGVVWLGPLGLGSRPQFLRKLCQHRPQKAKDICGQQNVVHFLFSETSFFGVAKCRAKCSPAYVGFQRYACRKQVSDDCLALFEDCLREERTSQTASKQQRVQRLQETSI